MRRWALRVVPAAGPESLAVARIGTAVAGLLFLEIAWSPTLGTIPRPLWKPPLGTSFLVDVLPVSRVAVVAAALLLTVGIVGTLLGAWHRWSAGLAVMAMFYLGWVHQLSGKTDHYHHVLWFLLIVAVSPAADRWSVDAWRRSGSATIRRRRQTDYALPLTAMIVIIGLVYFFAGLAKLQLGGIEWITSDNLRNIMHRLWWEKALDPVPFVDGYGVSRLIAALAVTFELAFLPLILVPKLRRYARYVGILFHLGTWMVLGISFLTLQVVYVVFFDWSAPSAMSIRQGAERRSRRAKAGTAWVVVTALVVGVAGFGIAHVERSWPLAAYPTFAARSGTAQPVILEVEVTTSDGSSMFLRDSQLAAQYGPPHAFAMMYHGLIDARGGDPTALQAFSQLLASTDGELAGTIVAIDSVQVRLTRSDGDVISRNRVYTLASE